MINSHSLKYIHRTEENFILGTNRWVEGQQNYVLVEVKDRNYLSQEAQDLNAPMSKLKTTKTSSSVMCLAEGIATGNTILRPSERRKECNRFKWQFLAGRENQIPILWSYSGMNRGS